MVKTFKQLREDTLDEQHFSHVGKDVSQKLSYDNWLKKIKGIKKGAHGTKGDEHTKLSKQWRDYKKEEVEVELDEGKYTQYSSLLVQKGKLLAKGFIPQSITVTRINKEIEKEKKKLGIEEDLDPFLFGFWSFWWRVLILEHSREVIVVCYMAKHIYGISFI